MQILLNLLAGVALLVWGTHIVRTGILRLWGGDLRRFLGDVHNFRAGGISVTPGISVGDAERRVQWVPTRSVGTRATRCRRTCRSFYNEISHALASRSYSDDAILAAFH